MKQWDLSILYSDFDDPKLASDQKELDKLINDLTALTNNLSVAGEPKENILAFYHILNQIISLFETLGNFGHLNYTTNTKNVDALKLIEKVESVEPLTTVCEVQFKKWLKTVDTLDELLKDLDILPYAFKIKSALDEAKYMLSDEEEALIAELKNTGSNAWSKLQDATISSLTADYEGESLPITVIRSYAYDADADKRKKAYEAEIKSYDKVASISASALNAIKGEVISVANKRGYTSPIEMTLKNSRMDPETLDAMMTAIKEYLPTFRAYMKKKAEMLGHKNGLPFYDLFAPIGSVNLTYSYDEARTFVIDNFAAYSEKLGDFASNAFDNNWIDPEPREGKVSGAYCSNIHSKKESRIMANFNGSLNDVSTLAHELGHGYHGDCLKNELPINSDYPMPIAETASIFCETIVTNAALKTASKEEALVIIENSVMSANQVITDIYSRYLFETTLFEGRKEASLSVEELKAAMLDAQKASYGDGLDPEYLHPYMWVCKPHYYDAGYNFYNFPYAFGLLFALGLYAKYKVEGESFLEKYDDLLRATGANNIHDVLAIAGVDSHNPDFFRASLELIKKDIEFILEY